MVFGIGAALAAIAGIMAAPILSVSPGMGDKIIIIAFVVVVIGGIGSIKGAFVGALLVGLMDCLRQDPVSERELAHHLRADGAGPGLAAGGTVREARAMRPVSLMALIVALHRACGDSAAR